MWFLPRWVVDSWVVAEDILVEIVVVLYEMLFNRVVRCLVNIAIHCGLK